MKPTTSPFLQQTYHVLEHTRSATTAALYTEWIRKYVLFHRFRQADDMRGDARNKIQAFLFALHASANTQNQALCALLALYHDILEDPIEEGWQRMNARRGYHLPEILSRQDSEQIFSEMQGGTKIMAQLLYGSGLKLHECASLRIQQILFEEKQILLKKHWTILPKSLLSILENRIHFVAGCYQLKNLHDESRYYLFPESALFEPDIDVSDYNHIHPNSLQKAMHVAARKCHQRGTLLKDCTCQTLRDSFAVEIMRSGGVNIRQVQEFLGIKDIRHVMRYLRFLPIHKF